MDAATFLKKSSKPGATTPGSRPSGNKREERSSAAESGSPPTAAPVSEPVVFSDTTPSGIVVEYQAKPKRLYRVNGVEVPSVTTVLDVLAKNGLSWWGMQQGVSGVIELFQRSRLGSVINWSEDDAQQKLVLIPGDDPLTHEPATTENIVAALTAEKLTVNHRLSEAGDRGTNVHAALEAWAGSDGEFFRSPANYPDEERPYVEALLQWVDALDGAASIAGCEIMVGSAEHGFAGRYDLVIELTESRTFVRKAYKRKDKMLVKVDPGRYLVDMKSSSGVYTSHFRQLAGYEVASIESGYPATKGQFVLHVQKDGQYQFVPSAATADDFLTTLALWKTEQRLKGKA
jgi:hypothetical protein